MSETTITWRHGLLVFAGGALGTALRALVLQAPADARGEGWTLAAANIVGAFLLGLLTGFLDSVAATRMTRAARLLFGTGVLGGFTSYSALAVSATGSWALAAVAVGSAVAGLGAAWLGLRAGRALPGTRSAR